MAEQHDAPDTAPKPYRAPSLRRLGADRAEGKFQVNPTEDPYMTGATTIGS